MSLNQKIQNFQNKKVWLIGASSGIGLSLAHRLIQEGAQVALSARRIDRLKTIQASYPTSQALILECDVCSDVSLHQAYQTISNSWGSIDLLIYVAGIYEPMRVEDFNLDIAKKTIFTNLIGAMSACSLVMSDFIKNSRGGIAIVSSVAGYSGLPKALAYGPSKAALINFCENLYYDLSPLGINVYMINPGFVETEATAKNDFYMPALISSDEAALEILSGMKAGEFDIHFPKRFSRFLKFLRILPYPIYFYLLRKTLKI